MGNSINPENNNIVKLTENNINNTEDKIQTKSNVNFAFLIFNPLLITIIERKSSKRRVKLYRIFMKCSFIIITLFEL
jgi:hypothetical protein